MGGVVSVPAVHGGWLMAPSGFCPQEYAGEGLRTLLLAYKDLDEEYYEEWAERRLQASLAQDCREDRLASVYEEVENDMVVWAGPGAGAGPWWLVLGEVPQLGVWLLSAAGRHSH